MYTGRLIDELTEIVMKHEARLQANAPTEQEWKTFLDDGLPTKDSSPTLGE